MEPEPRPLPPVAAPPAAAPDEPPPPVAASPEPLRDRIGNPLLAICMGGAGLGSVCAAAVTAGAIGGAAMAAAGASESAQAAAAWAAGAGAGGASICCCLQQARRFRVSENRILAPALEGAALAAAVLGLLAILGQAIRSSV